MSSSVVRSAKFNAFVEKYGSAQVRINHMSQQITSRAPTTSLPLPPEISDEDLAKLENLIGPFRTDSKYNMSPDHYLERAVSMHIFNKSILHLIRPLEQPKILVIGGKIDKECKFLATYIKNATIYNLNVPFDEVRTNSSKHFKHDRIVNMSYDKMDSLNLQYDIALSCHSIYDMKPKDYRRIFKHLQVPIIHCIAFLTPRVYSGFHEENAFNTAFKYIPNRKNKEQGRLIMTRNSNSCTYINEVHVHRELSLKGFYSLNPISHLRIDMQYGIGGMHFFQIHNVSKIVPFVHNIKYDSNYVSMVLKGEEIVLKSSLMADLSAFAFKNCSIKNFIESAMGYYTTKLRVDSEEIPENFDKVLLASICIGAYKRRDVGALYEELIHETGKKYSFLERIRLAFDKICQRLFGSELEATEIEKMMSTIKQVSSYSYYVDIDNSFYGLVSEIMSRDTIFEEQFDNMKPSSRLAQMNRYVLTLGQFLFPEVEPIVKHAMQDLTLTTKSACELSEMFFEIFDIKVPEMMKFGNGLTKYLKDFDLTTEELNTEEQKEMTESTSDTTKDEEESELSSINTESSSSSEDENEAFVEELEDAESEHSNPEDREFVEGTFNDDFSMDGHQDWGSLPFPDDPRRIIKIDTVVAPLIEENLEKITNATMSNASGVPSIVDINSSEALDDAEIAVNDLDMYIPQRRSSENVKSLEIEKVTNKLDSTAVTPIPRLCAPLPYGKVNDRPRVTLENISNGEVEPQILPLIKNWRIHVKGAINEFLKDSIYSMDDDAELLPGLNGEIFRFATILKNTLEFFGPKETIVIHGPAGAGKTKYILDNFDVKTDGYVCPFKFVTGDTKSSLKGKFGDVPMAVETFMKFFEYASNVTGTLYIDEYPSIMEGYQYILMFASNARRIVKLGDDRQTKAMSKHFKLKYNPCNVIFKTLFYEANTVYRFCGPAFDFYNAINGGIYFSNAKEENYCNIHFYDEASNNFGVGFDIDVDLVVAHRRNSLKKFEDFEVSKTCKAAQGLSVNKTIIYYDQWVDSNFERYLDATNVAFSRSKNDVYIFLSGIELQRTRAYEIMQQQSIKFDMVCASGETIRKDF